MRLATSLAVLAILAGCGVSPTEVEVAPDMAYVVVGEPGADGEPTPEWSLPPYLIDWPVRPWRGSLGMFRP